MRAGLRPPEFRFSLPRGVCAVLAAAALGVGAVRADEARANRTTVPHVLRYATSEDIATLNPEIATQTVVTYLSQMTMAHLFTFDRNNALVPELATTIPTFTNRGISKDGLSITLHLRGGVKWSDGRPFDSGDVVFSWTAMMNPANLIPSREGFDRIASIDAPDALTAIVHLRQPYGAIVPTLFSSSGLPAVLPKHLLGTLANINTGAYNDLPVGIGPFRYKSWKRSDAVELEANPYYWRGRPKLQRIVYKLLPDRNTVLAQLQTGEIDLWYPFGGAYLARVQSIPTVDVLRQPGYAVNEYVFNTSHAALRDRNVRRALRLAIDRRAMRDKVGHGVGLLQDVPFPTIDAAVPKNVPFVEYDPEKANALLDAAGWKRGSDGVRIKDRERLSLSLATSSGTPDVDTIVELLRTWWNGIGVELNVQRYAGPLLFAPAAEGGILYGGKFDVLALGLTYSEPLDPNSFACAAIPPNGQNVSRYCNPDADKAIADFQRSYDEKRRAADLAIVARHVADDVPIVVTTGRENLFALNTDLKHFGPNSVSAFDDMLNVDI